MTKEHENKKNTYLEAIIRLANFPASREKDRKLELLLNDYYLYCYYKGLDCSFDVLRPLLDKSYIIPSRPIIDNISEEYVIPIVDKLKDNMGVTEEEAELLIKCVVQNARNVIGKTCDIYSSSLIGKCGYGQALTLVPFQQIGVNTTINNTFNFPNCNSFHAFGTVIMPISLENTGSIDYYSQFLIDITYRQFFSTITACLGRYYVPYGGSRNKNAPMHGYHMVRYDGGLKIANKLLKDGYIKLAPDVLKAYGTCFALQSLPFSCLSEKEEIMKVDVSEYLKSLEMQTDFSFDYVELMEIDYLTKLPSSDLKR